MAELTNTEIGALRALLRALRVVASEHVKGENEWLRPRVEKLTEENNRYVQERNGWANNLAVAVDALETIACQQSAASPSATASRALAKIKPERNPCKETTED